MPSCTSCGSYIPEGQGSSCSMCYGDPYHGSDGYYLEMLEAQAREEAERDRAEEAWIQEQQEAELDES